MPQRLRLAIFGMPRDAAKDDVLELFKKYGPIQDVCVRTCNQGRSVVAFAQFEKAEDAEDAQRGRDDYQYDGGVLRVEFAKKDLAPGERGPSMGRAPPLRENFSKGKGKGYGMNRGGAATKLKITGIPQGTAWQDLKDWLREGAAGISFADVERPHGEEAYGIAGYERYDDAEKCCDRLDGRELRIRSGETAKVSVKLLDGRRGGGRGRSRDRRSRRRGRDSRSRSRGRDSRKRSHKKRSRDDSRKRSDSRRR